MTTPNVDSQLFEVGLLEIGAETSDKSSFFSLQNSSARKAIFDYRVLDRSESQNSAKFEHLWSSRDGEYALTRQTASSSSEIRILQTLSVERETLVQDMVVRFVFKKEFVKKISFGECEYHHEGSNRWNQQDESTADLHLMDGIATITIESSDCADGSKAVMYIRDFEDQWVVHCRIFPLDSSDFTWLRWMHRFGTWEAPTFVTIAIRKFLPKLWNRLWYLSERSCGRHQIQAQGLIRVTPDRSLGLRVSARFSRDF